MQFGCGGGSASLYVTADDSDVLIMSGNGIPDMSLTKSVSSRCHLSVTWAAGLVVG
jgi:hypothetical protein